ncbi:MoxR-like ATPase [Rheinheimera sp. A13L]|uniref:AAA family ATPase n=1 Tax=Rheinheimera sp. A13L TaxID=506534 RepID=UPI0002124CD3|nr:MoxR family ATPase [Rheinheimera sp. A13L]EGM79740.1 MoxR-like ATPase [Rheinheimera sp. A13L]
MKTTMNPATLPEILPLPAPLQGQYLLPPEAKTALQLACVRPRPLLVVGEAGVGKSQLALALATHWQVPCLKFVVQSGTQADELLYHFDAVQRLAQAQVLGASRCAQDAVTQLLQPKRFLQPGVMWWALNWQNAMEHILNNQVQYAVLPPQPEGWRRGAGCVVLIDEIDKATSDVPNNLLDVLDCSCITLPTGEIVEPAAIKPLIIITSNGDRDLPAPFLRRCYVLHLDFPIDNPEEWLLQRARVHFTREQLADPVLRIAAQQILADRYSASNIDYKPGVSEYLDLLYAVDALSKDAEQQCELLKQLGQYVLKREIRR